MGLRRPASMTECIALISTLPAQSVAFADRPQVAHRNFALRPRKVTEVQRQQVQLSTLPMYAFILQSLRFACLPTIILDVHKVAVPPFCVKVIIISMDPFMGVICFRAGRNVSQGGQQVVELLHKLWRQLPSTHHLLPSGKVFLSSRCSSHLVQYGGREGKMLRLVLPVLPFMVTDLCFVRRSNSVVRTSRCSKWKRRLLSSR